MNNKLTLILLIVLLLYGCGVSHKKSVNSFDVYQQIYESTANKYPSYIQAKDAYSKKNYKNAIKYYNQYLSQNPKDGNWLIHNHLGWSYYFLGQYRKAVEEFNKAIKLTAYMKTTPYGNFQGLGRCYQLLKMYKESIEAYDKYKKFKPTDPEPYNWNGWSYYSLMEFDKAIEEFENSIKYDVKKIFVNNYLGIGRCFYQKGNYQDALKNLLEYVKYKPNDYIGLNRIGWTYYQIGDIANAFDYFIKSNLIQKDGGNFEGLGLCEFERNNNEQAEKYLLKAIEYYSNTNDVFRVKLILSEFYLNQGDYNKAAEFMKNTPYLGLVLEENYFGAKVVKIVKNSPADFAGFQLNDIIKSINGISLKGMKVTEIVNNIIRKLSPYSWLDMEIIRRGKTKNLKSFVGITVDLPDKYTKTNYKTVENINKKKPIYKSVPIHREKWALIIGISKYKDSRIQSLRYASADAQSFYDWLVSNNGGRYSPARVRLLINENATFQNIRDALFTWLRQPLKEDMITIFYAGHGSSDSPDTPENLYLLPYDTDYNNIATTGFPMWDFETALRRFIHAEQVVIIADACHSGGIGEDFDRQRRGNRALKANRINSSLEKLTDTGKGVAILSSASDNQLAQESSKWGGGHGVFTYYLLKGLKGDADYNGDKVVTMGELIPYVSEKVRRSTYNSQSPTIAGKFDPALSISKK